LFGVLVLANALAAVRLVALVLHGSLDSGAPLTVSRLLVAGAIVLVTNIVTFGVVYWQVDGGGPGGRLVHAAPYPDFQFPQTATEGLSPPDWQPRFPDHLYLSFTNVVAFSPTDTLPLTIRVKVDRAPVGDLPRCARSGFWAESSTPCPHADSALPFL
jgi:hypothetical protein